MFESFTGCGKGLLIFHPTYPSRDFIKDGISHLLNLNCGPDDDCVGVQTKLAAGQSCKDRDFPFLAPMYLLWPTHLCPV